MLHSLCQIADAAPHTLFGIDTATLGGGGLAAAFGAAWVFFRVVRKVIGTLFMLCVVYLVVKSAFGVDLAQYIAPLFKQGDCPAARQ